MTIIKFKQKRGLNVRKINRMKKKVFKITYRIKTKIVKLNLL